MNRIKQLRLAKGFSLHGLAQEMGGLVTKQALSKYEMGISKPRPTIASCLAAALGVKALYLWTPPAVAIDFIAFRRLSKLRKKEQEKIRALVGKTLEERCRLQERLGLVGSFDWIYELPIVQKTDDAESAAIKLREIWKLGTDSIFDLTGVLESRLVHVIEIESAREFDGISAIAKNERDEILATAVSTRRAIAGDRQRMNLAHELGHLALTFKGNLNEEHAAFRFAGAFLLPAETLRREIGETRTNIQLAELLALKRKFGISLQALLRRICDLRILADTAYKSWMIDIGRRGWRRVEPETILPEKPTWLAKILIRAVAEGVITIKEAKNVDSSFACEIPDLIQKNRAAFLRLSAEQRRTILEAQVRQARKYYSGISWQNDLESGEIENHASN